jgi:Uma2 family endonuclease
MATVPTTSHFPVVPDPRPAAREPVLPLENGDRLARAEFERRYAAMPPGTKFELIEGTVYMASQVSNTHGSPHTMVVTWLGTYWAMTPGVSSSTEGTVRLDVDNEPQPDVFLWVLPSHGGQARVDDDDFISGAPELIVEVAASSASYDLHDKLNAYRRNGVREYVVWRVYDQAVDWFVLREGKYEPMQPNAAGVFQSIVFPGLWLDSAALLRRDLAAVLQAVQAGIASPEHAAFVNALAAAAQTQKPGQL